MRNSCARRAQREGRRLRRSNQERVEKRTGRGVPYPGYFAKCAERFDWKGVARIPLLGSGQSVRNLLRAKSLKEMQCSECGARPEEVGRVDLVSSKHAECYHAGDDNRRVIQGMVELAS